MSDRRVLVTGLGPVTSAGIGAAAFHEAQLTGHSGTRAPTRLPADGAAPVAVGEVDLPDELAPPRRLAVRSDRVAHLASAAARLALADAMLDPATLDHTRAGVVIGTGVGGAEGWTSGVRAIIEQQGARFSARTVPRTMCNAAAAYVAIEHGLTGPTESPALACASGAQALVAGYQMIVSGEADVVLAGGAEAPLVPAVVAGFAAMGALSARPGDPAGASRPFSADRDGFVLAEGAAVLVLESADHARRRAARVLAELAGFGRSTDAHHVTAPLPDGSVAARAVDATLRHARLTPSDVSFVNAHGTGTVRNDAAEALALRLALGDVARRVPVSSTKSQTGHALGAAGAIEAVASVQAVFSGLLPATINLREADPELDLDVVVGGPREAKVEAVLSDSFAFGGHNVVLAFRRA